MTKLANLQNRKIEIIPGCIVCKTCEFTAPGNFHVEEKSLSAVVVNPYPAETQLKAVIEAIKLCPVHVIKFRTEKK